jgi:hypothetical protein
MSWRKWLVRILVFAILGGVASAAFIYHRWTNSATVKRQALTILQAHFPGAEISLDSAHLRLLGEVSLNDLHLSRRDGIERTEFAYIPSAIVYHDKEQLNDGKLVIRKVELSKPRLRFVRLADGSWNVSQVLGPSQLEAALPILIIKDGTIIFEDQMQGARETPSSAIPRVEKVSVSLSSLAPGAGTRAPIEGGSSVEIKNVNLVIVHDGHGPITFEGNGKCPLAGPLKIKGSWLASNGRLSVSLQGDAIPVTPAFMKRLAAYWPEAGEHAEQLEGTASLQAELTYLSKSEIRNSKSEGQNPKSENQNSKSEMLSAGAWTHNFHWQLHQGKFRHAQCPCALEEIEAKGHCMEGRITLERLTARAGSAKINMDGTAKGLTADSDFNGNLSIVDLNVTKEMLNRMGAKFQKINIEYSPHGLVDLTCHLERTSGKWHRHADVRLKDIAGEFSKFRYPVEHVSGQLIQEFDTLRSPAIDRVTMNLVGWGGSQKVYIKGEVNGDGPDAAVAVRIWGDNFPLDAKMKAALDSKQQKLAESFHPEGLANFDADIRRAAFSKRFNNHYVIHFHGGTARYDLFPYPLENVEGDLDIQEDSWEFRNFSASHKGCRVVTWGGSHPTAGGPQLEVHVEGQGLILDGELESSLQEPELKHAWRSFHPTGKMDFTARVVSVAQFLPEVAVTVTPIDCSVRPDVFPYLLTHLTGKLRYENRQVHVEKLRAVHEGGTVMTLDQMDVILNPDGGVYAKLSNLEGAPLVPNEDLRRAMPEVLRNICESLALRDAVRLKVADMRIATPGDKRKPSTVYWDGELNVTDATLNAGIAMEHVTGKIACRGSCQGDALRTEPGHSPLVGNLLIQDATILKQPFHNVHAILEVPEMQPNTLVLRGIHGSVFGGEVYGETKVDLGANPAYEVNLTGSQIRLEDFARHNLKPGVKMTGAASARLYLTGRGKDIQSINGSGSIDVPKGRMYELNPLLDLLKILNLRVPDGTAFEEAHASFTIRGKRVTINRMDLLGSPVSLGGKGQMNLDGSDLNLEFYAVWARVMQVLPPIINEIPQAISKQFLKIKLRGDLGVKVETVKEPVPILVDPLKELLDAMAGRKARSAKSEMRNSTDVSP